MPTLQIHVELCVERSILAQHICQKIYFEFF